MIPLSLQPRALSLAHEGHQGIVKTKQLLREKVWFPGIDKQVEGLISSCIPCQSATPSTEHQPLQMSDLPDGPWQKISIDFCGPFPSGDHLLVILDEYTRSPFIEIATSTSAKTVIPLLDKVFSTVGLPKEVKSDNGPPFSGHDFANFASDLGFHHRKLLHYGPKPMLKSRGS